MNRRDFLKTTGFSILGLAALSLGCGNSGTAPQTAAASSIKQTIQGAEQTMSKINGKKVLVAYFSWSGNTKALAQTIQAKTGGDIYEIVPETPYSETYAVTVAKAKQEQLSNARPAIKNNLPNVADYDVVFLGYPNWWGSYPMPVATFVEKFQWQGKTIAPFFTHGGGGIQNCERDLKRIAPAASFTAPLVLAGNNARNAGSDVDTWLKNITL